MTLCHLALMGPQQQGKGNRRSTYNMNFLGFMSKDKYLAGNYAMKALKIPEPDRHVR